MLPGIRKILLKAEVPEKGTTYNSELKKPDYIN